MRAKASYGPSTIPRDAAFPQLEQLGDLEGVSRALERRLGARFSSGELSIGDCAITRVDARPGRDGECWLQLRARIRNRVKCECGEQLFSAQLFAPGRARERFERARLDPAVEPAFGEPVCLVPEWNMVVWAYPNDPALPALSWLADSGRVVESMRAAPGMFGLGSGELAERVEVELGKYVPARRCSALLRIAIARQPDERRVHAKAYRGSAVQRAFGIARGIAESVAPRGGALRVAQPHGVDPGLGILFQEALPGTPLSRLLSERDLCTEAEQAGAALAALHALRLELPERCTLSSELLELGAKGDLLLRAFPGARIRIEALRKRLVGVSRSLGAAPQVTVHGSFKPSHVMAAAGGVALIDLDGASRGDAAYDLGRFAAHLLGASLSGRLPRANADALLGALQRGYAQLAERPVAERRWRWFAASHLLTSQLYKAVKRIDLGLTEPLLDLSAEVLACP